MVPILEDDMGFRADVWVVGAQNGEGLTAGLLCCVGVV
jgi:hypothetical protein